MDNLFEAINQGRLDLVKTFLTDDPNLIKEPLHKRWVICYN